VKNPRADSAVRIFPTLGRKSSKDWNPPNRAFYDPSLDNSGGEGYPSNPLFCLRATDSGRIPAAV
jgi:hypothetical protein